MPRRLSEQVVVITGASSGVGRATAHALAARGASVVLVARNAAALQDVATEVEQAGGTAEVVIADVADWEQVERVVHVAIHRFGRVDTWLNNAGSNIYGTVEQLTIEEIERVIQVNQLGQIYGMKAILPHFMHQRHGTIINVTASAAMRSLPLQAAFSSAAHGVRGFTEALRLELARDYPEIRLTIIMPGSINTPFFTNARSKLGVRPRPLTPVYDPDVIVEAILHACEHQHRDIFTTPIAELQEILDALDPSLLDWYRTRNGRAINAQKTREADDGQDNLFAPRPTDSYAIRGEWRDAKSSSIYVRYFQLHPNIERILTGTLVLGGLTLAGWTVRRGR